jgi:aminopeptidase N
MKNRISIIILTLLSCLTIQVYGQKKNLEFCHADSLRGVLDSNRASYDVLRYNITIEPDFKTKTIAGTSQITFRWINRLDVFRFDLDTNLAITSIKFHGKSYSYKRSGAAVFVVLSKVLRTTEKQHTVEISYTGKPHISLKAPWEGGMVWDTLAGKPWMGTTCEGEGASLWYACKDHLSDKADVTDITIITPADLMGVSNGNLISYKMLANGKKSWHWRCSYPAPNYSIAVYVGNYEHVRPTNIFVLFPPKISKQANTDEEGNISPIIETRRNLAIDYYVLKGNKEKALAHFKQVKPMLAAFEHYLESYPFWKDGYALVETPYWGMEHQSAIAYGNHYKNNAYGFDFIIVHESGHEYFGNAVSAADHANLFIQESFCTYMETLYLEFTQGKQVSLRWLGEERAKVKNQHPMAGPEGVNFQNFLDNDAYYKGACMLHTFRTMVGDSLFFSVFKDYYSKNKYKSILLDDYARTFTEPLGASVDSLSELYLHQSGLPNLDYFVDESGLYMRIHEAADQELLVPIIAGNEIMTVKLNQKWKFIGKYGDGVSLADPIVLLSIKKVSKMD